MLPMAKMQHAMVARKGTALWHRRTWGAVVLVAAVLLASACTESTRSFYLREPGGERPSTLFGPPTITLEREYDVPALVQAAVTEAGLEPFESWRHTHAYAGPPQEGRTLRVTLDRECRGLWHVHLEDWPSPDRRSARSREVERAIVERAQATADSKQTAPSEAPEPDEQQRDDASEDNSEANGATGNEKQAPESEQQETSQAGNDENEVYYISDIELKGVSGDAISLETIKAAPVSLHQVNGHWTIPGEDDPGTSMRLDEVALNEGRALDVNAVRAVLQFVRNAYQEHGFAAIVVAVDPATLPALADPDEPGTLTLHVVEGRIENIAVVQGRAGAAPEDAWEDAQPAAGPIADRILEDSPVEEGNLVRRDKIGEFLKQLRRDPDFHVEAVFAPSSADDVVDLYYLIIPTEPEEDQDVTRD